MTRAVLVLAVALLAGCAETDQRWVRTLVTPQTAQCFEKVKEQTCTQFIHGSVHVWLAGYKILTDETQDVDVRYIALQMNKTVENNFRQLDALPECYDTQNERTPKGWLIRLGVEP